MYCTKCGAKIDDDSLYCINCGSVLRQNRKQRADQAESKIPEEQGSEPVLEHAGPSEIKMNKSEQSAPVRQETVQSAPRQTSSEKTAPVQGSSVQAAPKQKTTERPAPAPSGPVQITSDKGKNAADHNQTDGRSYDPDADPTVKINLSDTVSRDTSSGSSNGSGKKTVTHVRAEFNGSSGNGSSSSGGSGTTPPPSGSSGSSGSNSRANDPSGGTQYQRIRENRGWFRYIILSIITCGIYALYYTYALARDVNIMCGEDGKHTAGLLGYIGLTIITFGYFAIYWGASIVDRVAANLALQYNIQITSTGLKYILWNIPGILLVGIGPFIALHTMLKSVNQLAVAYNAKYNR